MIYYNYIQHKKVMIRKRSEFIDKLNTIIHSNNQENRFMKNMTYSFSFLLGRAEAGITPLRRRAGLDPGPDWAERGGGDAFQHGHSRGGQACPHPPGGESQGGGIYRLQFIPVYFNKKRKT